MDLICDNWTNRQVEMQLLNGEWRVDITPNVGENYYRFLVNKKMILNDPQANLYHLDAEGEIWSVLLIGQQRNRLYNNMEYFVNIEDYLISNSELTTGGKSERKKYFNLLVDKKMTVWIDYAMVTGIHVVTMVLVDPAGNIYDSANSNLYPTASDSEIGTSMCFQMDLQAEDYEFQQGVWRFMLFVDGEYILQEYIQLGTSTLYRSDGSYMPNKSELCIYG